MKRALANGADPNASKALHQAVCGNKIGRYEVPSIPREAVQLLLEAKADPNLPGDSYHHADPLVEALYHAGGHQIVRSDNHRVWTDESHYHRPGPRHAWLIDDLMAAGLTLKIKHFQSVNSR